MNYNKGPRERQNLFAITRFYCIKVLVHNYTFTITWVKRILFVIPRTSLYRGLSYRGSTVLIFFTFFFK